ncbi:MAG: type II toxin-antitoxin system VapC family toxin [Candidatus Hydrothermarchaeales archaeon]
MIYLDSNVFIIAALYTDDVGEKARELIKAIEEGEVKAATSALTYDEVYWAVKKLKDKNAAHKAGGGLLMLPNIHILEVDRNVLFTAHKLLSDYSLDPRDAIHAACAISKKISDIVSQDGDFDRIKGLKRTQLADFKLTKVGIE